MTEYLTLLEPEEPLEIQQMKFSYHELRAGEMQLAGGPAVIYAARGYIKTKKSPWIIKSPQVLKLQTDEVKVLDVKTDSHLMVFLDESMGPWKFDETREDSLNWITHYLKDDCIKSSHPVNAGPYPLQFIQVSPKSQYSMLQGEKSLSAVQLKGDSWSLYFDEDKNEFLPGFHIGPGTIYTKNLKWTERGIENCKGSFLAGEDGALFVAIGRNGNG